MRYETRYARSGDTHIAYQVIGDGPLDLVFVMGWISHLDYFWEGPSADFLNRLASFSRLILFDKRGTGLSDRVAELPTIEQRMDDVRAVMDVVGSERASLLGVSEGGPMSTVFAATYPERTDALILYGSFSAFKSWVPTPEQLDQLLTGLEATWGTGASLPRFAPSVADDPGFRQQWARRERQGASPGALIALMRMNSQIDIEHVLPAVRVP